MRIDKDKGEESSARRDTEHLLRVMDPEARKSVLAWGSARYGMLGIGDFSALPADPDDENDQYSDVPVVVPALRGLSVAQLACGGCHSLALTSAGDVFAWGSARHGVLGIGDFSALPADPDDENDL